MTRSRDVADAWTNDDGSGGSMTKEAYDEMVAAQENTPPIL